MSLNFRGAEVKNITRTTDELHISQPALSRYIHDVAEEVGTKIFYRSTDPNMTHDRTTQDRDITRQSFVHAAGYLAGF